MAFSGEATRFESMDQIARQIARSAALNRPRQAPNYLPDANQIRNARDVSREIVAGLTEGLEIGNCSDRGLEGAAPRARFPEEEMTATIVMQWPDGATIELRDQMVRLQDQNRSL